MSPTSQPRIGLLAIRVSSDKQGLDGDSPEAQNVSRAKLVPRRITLSLQRRLFCLSLLRMKYNQCKRSLMSAKIRAKAFRLFLLSQLIALHEAVVIIIHR